jgi:hypothetical protein
MFLLIILYIYIYYSMPKTKKPLNPIKECENTFCNKYTKKVVDFSKDMIKIIAKKYKIEDLDKKTKLELYKKIKNIEDKLKSKKFITESKKSCKTAFCNPSCKGTIFQSNEFPKEIEKKYSKKKDGKVTIDFLKKIQDSLYNGKKTIIKDDFYIKLKNIKKLKKEGAISGCTIASL